MVGEDIKKLFKVLTNNEYVIKLQKKELDLIKISNYYGFYNDACKDVIQELYLKLLNLKDINRYTIDDEPNMYIIFAILRNLIYDIRKKENRFIKNELFDIPIEDEELDNDKYLFTIKEINNIENWFSKRLIKIYLNDEHTIRSLSAATKIGTNVIHRTIFKFKCDVKKKWEDKNKNQKF